MTNKSALRQFFRNKRKTLSATDLAYISNAILKRVVAKNLIHKGPVMLYLDSSNHHEIPMGNWFDAFEELTICVPKVIGTNGQMEAIMWQKGMSVLPNKWGILEPISDAYINPASIEAIVVPLLCFDQNGHRVGYGKGYYDRFLSRCAPTCKTIGVSCFEPIEKIEDATQTDVGLQMAVTPKKIYSF